jgi:hypothetical protein
MVKLAVACPSHLLITAVGTPRRCIKVPQARRAETPRRWERPEERPTWLVEPRRYMPDE